MTEAEIENIKNDYLHGMKYNDIMNKYDITQPELRSIIRRNKLTRSKSEIQKGNQNAKRNKGGKGAKCNNSNAVVTGEYEQIYKDILTEEELKLYENYKISDNDELQMKEYIHEYKILTIRENRMMKRIKKLEGTEKDMTIGHIKKKNSGGAIETITEAGPTIDTIQRIEDGLTRVQEAKRKSRENMIKLGFSKKTLELKEKQIDNELW